MRALSIRQPFAELILRGIKTVEYRTQPTRILGERFYIYATKRPLSGVGGPWAVTRAENIVVPRPPDTLPGWMIELAEQVGMIEAELLTAGAQAGQRGRSTQRAQGGQGGVAGLPMGVIVGSAVIERCAPVQPTTDDERRTPFYEWHLAGVERAKQLLKPTGHPQPVWFEPF